MFLRPPLPHGSQELFPAGSHLLDKRLVAGFFVLRCPKHHLRQHGREIHALDRQRIDHFPAIRRISFRADNSVGVQPAQPVRQDIGGDFFVRVEKFVKGLVSAKHHVAQDQERPAVPQHLHRSIQRASGTALGRRFLFLHKFRVAIFTCILQVRLPDCFSEENGA
jgi:hypothetical protein